MRDLTQGPVPGHLLTMAAPLAAGMLAQTLYLLIDLYFVAQLGEAALAGVGAAARKGDAPLLKWDAPFF